VHKALTVLLACKILQVYAAYSRLSACPFPNAPATLLRVLEGVSGSLFETGFDALLVGMSAGLFVVREELSRCMANYLVGMVSLLYLGVSVQSMLETETGLLSLLLLGLVWAHCSFFALIAYFSSFPPLLRRQYLLFLCIEQLFFLFQTAYCLLSNTYLAQVPADSDKLQVWRVGLHETLEAVGVSAVFALFTLSSYSFPQQRVGIVRFLPLYRSNEGLSSTVPEEIAALAPVIVVNPGKVQAITLGFVVETPEIVEEPRNTEVELSFREIRR